ncbi:uncharacterized protein LOC134877204 [Eleginops maclovinus]|uniref:uncharacterized protein LOC134877204 n=1 Tax=Eleginops maclovinus TaxID=56733 RepID=UPI003080DD22
MNKVGDTFLNNGKYISTFLLKKQPVQRLTRRQRHDDRVQTDYIISTSYSAAPVYRGCNRTGLPLLSVRVGDEVTLPCNNVIQDQDECDGTTWLSTGSRVELVRHGQIGNRAHSDRLRVTETCSLVIKKVTKEDAGRYFCRQIRSGEQQGPDSEVDLSVVTMTEHQDTDEVTLHCSVKSERCLHSVKWLYQGTDVDKDNREMRTSESPCYASVTFPTSHYGYTSRSNLFRCAVTASGNVQTFSLQSSGEDDGAAKTKTPTPTPTTTTSQNIKQPDWWLYLFLALVLVALLIIIVAIIRWRKMKGKEARTKDSVDLTSNSAKTAPETSQADPEDGVSYASVSYTKKTNKKAQVKVKKDVDEGDAVTYTTVKASTIDPSSLYATIY